MNLKTTDQVLLCTDLDRTLLPNGPEPESSGARGMIGALARQGLIRLTYVTGRDKTLVSEAIKSYNLPWPDFVIADVGTTIYCTENRSWNQVADWNKRLQTAWQGLTAKDIEKIVTPLPECRLQEKSKQKLFKLSFYLPLESSPLEAEQTLKNRLEHNGLRAQVIHSVDQVHQTRLLDILPPEADKNSAIVFLADHLGFGREDCLFCGDSGNDLDVFAGPMHSVLVANALPEVKDKVRKMAENPRLRQKNYIAQGGFLHMNGCYAAGILEGLAHFFPTFSFWMHDPVHTHDSSFR